MKYAKLIDGELVLAPRKLRLETATVYNPTQEMLTEAGYKPVRYADPPETDPGYIAVPGWEETDEEIVQIWTVKEEPDEIDEARAYRIIAGEEE